MDIPDQLNDICGQYLNLISYTNFAKEILYSICFKLPIVLALS